MKAISLSQAQYSSGQQREWIYNALDTLATREICETLDQQMDATSHRTHDFYMALQNTAMDMTFRGILVDEAARQEAISNLTKETAALERGLGKREDVVAIWDKLEKETGNCKHSTRKDGKHTWEKGVEDGPERKCVSCGRSRMKVRPFKPSSDDDMAHLFYDLLKMKKQFNKDHKVTTDKEARERLKHKYPKHESLIEAIDLFKNQHKKLQFLRFRETANGRFCPGFNVGVTNTGRWSSNKNAFGEASNAQNVTEELRYIMIADKGMELCYADLKQAESNIIAHEAGDEAYIEAHRVGDTHTYVTRLIWPEGVMGKEWTGDIGEDKKIATSGAPEWDNRPGHDFRFQSKSIQHGSNLGRTAFGISIKQHITVEKAREGQLRYFRAFPGIRDYQNDIRQAVRDQRHIINCLGIRFKLYGRPWDDHTVRQGLAIKPQSTVGHVIGIGCYRIMRDLPEIELLAQVHDAILFQFPKGRYDLVYQALEAMTVELPIKGVDGKLRTTTIGTEAAVGHNWGHHVSVEKAKAKGVRPNPEGIREIVFKSPTDWSIK